MGKLIYGSGHCEIECDDRTLAHLKVVMITKLRRGESFTFNWHHGAEHGSGRSTIWVHPAIALEFSFFGNRAASLNRDWIEALLHSANSADGLRVIPEPDSGTPAP